MTEKLKHLALVVVILTTVPLLAQNNRTAPPQLLFHAAHSVRFDAQDKLREALGLSGAPGPGCSIRRTAS